MKPTTTTKLGCTLAGVLALTVSAYADTFGSGVNSFNLNFVPIGDAHNPAAPPNETGFGAVHYDYNLSTYAISQAQIDLAVANGFTNGTAGSWTGSQPATSITWYQAAAFVNWLNTSQGYPVAYNLDAGATMLTAGWSESEAFSLGYGGVKDFYRNANAHYFLPTESEYFKAAYYDPNSTYNTGYWPFATGSDTVPTAVASGTAPGTVVYDNVASQPAAVDSSGGLSPYGTMGQTGNVWEWMENPFSGGYTLSDGRAFRGGAWSNPVVNIIGSARGFLDPSESDSAIGFRVASVGIVPEPTSTVLMIGSGAVLLLRRRRPLRTNGSADGGVGL